MKIEKGLNECVIRLVLIFLLNGITIDMKPGVKPRNVRAIIYC